MNTEIWVTFFAALAGLLTTISYSLRRGATAFTEYKLKQGEHERDVQIRKMEHEREMQVRKTDHEREMEKASMERVERMARHMAQSTEATQQHTSMLTSLHGVIADLHRVVAGLANKYESGGGSSDTQEE